MNQHKHPTKEDIGDLNDAEIELIYLIRTKYRFGSIEIVTRDGRPQDILRTVERERISSL